MKAHVLALAALAAIGSSGAAFAEDGRWSTSTTTAPQVMTDSDMDRITAGSNAGDVGEHWGDGVGGGFSNPNNKSDTHTGAGNGNGGGLDGNNSPNGRF
jgi:hypothetical protein